MTILLTGATGFVGGALLARLSQQERCFTAAVRHANHNLSSAIQCAVVGDLLPETDWESALDDVSVVIHLAARAHIMDDCAVDPLAAFRQTNTEATLNLARQAADAGVSRFIYLSSIKVNGESTMGKLFTPDVCHAPNDPYGQSKYEAEQGLMQIAQQTGMDVVIIRPPLVYGPGVKGNFLSLLKWMERGIPLPLACVHNQRSLVGVNNLVDLIVTCIDHPAAANQTFLVSDGEDISTTELLQCMGEALGRSVRLVSVPFTLLELGARLVGKKDVTQRLLGDLQVDISKTKTLLGWAPTMTLNQGLQETARWYLQQR